MQKLNLDLSGVYMSSTTNPPPPQVQIDPGSYILTILGAKQMSVIGVFVIVQSGGV